MRGFLIDVFTTSESNLEVEFDCSHLTWDEYRNLIVELEDLLSEIDEKHSPKAWLVRGRSIKARYRRVTASDRERILRFSPFPSKFTNILKNVRGYVYRLVNENCIVLEEIGRRKVYLLPERLAPAFMEIIDRINRDVIGKLRKDVEEFRGSDDYLEIQRLLHRYNVNPMKLRTAVFPIRDFIIKVTPVNFNYNVDEAYRDMKERAAIKGLQILKEQIEKRRREYIVKAVSEITEKILEISEAISKRRRIKEAAKRIEKLMEICTSLRLEKINEEVLKPLKEIVQTKPYRRQELSKKYFETENISEGVKQKLKQISNFGGKS